MNEIIPCSFTAFGMSGGGWMKGADTSARVRREFLQRKRPIKKIAIELHISRNTVCKFRRSDATAFSYERERQPLPKIGPRQRFCSREECTQPHGVS